jgi:protein-S-isoprenylcysteine O-methyltransferase Ste14
MPPENKDTFTAKGGWLVVTQVTLMALVVASGPLSGRLATSPGPLAGAAALIALGAYFGVAGVRALGRNRTVYPKPRPDAELVQAGVFQLVRHPLYASLIHLGFGWALLWQSGIAAALSLVLAVQLHQKALREEAWLREKFPGYAAYARRVKRFIPRLW